MLSKGRRLEFANVAKGDDTMDEYNEIGARLRELREASDYTIEELAKELELDPEVYASYEENGKDVPISVIYQIANMFKVDFTEICTGQTAGEVARSSTEIRSITLRISLSVMQIKSCSRSWSPWSPRMKWLS